MFIYEEDDVQPSLLFIAILLIVLFFSSIVINVSDFSFNFLYDNIIYLAFLLFFILYSFCSSIYFIKRLFVLRSSIYGTINRHLSFLHTHPNLPKSCTIVPVFTVPKTLQKEIQRTAFSEASVQKMADYMNAYLGLMDSVKITIGIESSDNMLGIPDEISDKSKHAGYYHIRQEGGFEIHIIKKSRFKFSHVLAILAHELVHHYMYRKNIQLHNESEIEIFTDISAAYLGFGSLLIKGYKPIRWKKFIVGGKSINTMTIGYIKPYAVSYAVFQSAKLRSAKEFLSITPFPFNILILFRYLKKILRL